MLNSIMKILTTVKTLTLMLIYRFYLALFQVKNLKLSEKLAYNSKLKINEEEGEDQIRDKMKMIIYLGSRLIKVDCLILMLWLVINFKNLKIIKTSQMKYMQ